MPEIKNNNQQEQREPVVNIQGLYKSYGKKEVLMGLDLQVYEGELFGFIGKNGIGKSTTIDCVIGAKKFNSGKITLNGYDVLEEPIESKFSFGYVASEPSCYDAMTGYDYLELVASVYQITEGDFVRNYTYLCNRLSLDLKELSNPVSDYSHGMKQKLCLVASLLHSPKVWILDEPTVGLDIMAVEELKKMMREYADHGKTVFITSHNIELVARLCDRVTIINKGKVAALYDLNREPNRRIQLSKIFMDVYRNN
ncbi:MAG: ABC transporter ATP-binding protein [Clostridia bacterium]|nr:ABC transporter ATP-binding protein [Clostridia bacterium]